jgi:hypothetical protein
MITSFDSGKTSVISLTLKILINPWFAFYHKVKNVFFFTWQVLLINVPEAVTTAVQAVAEANFRYVWSQALL